MSFIVRYKVQGFDGEQVTEPYETVEIANTHLEDIRGYEGVTDAEIVPHEPLVEEARKQCEAHTR